MRGTEKQIKWAEDIKEQAIMAAGCIVRNAERDAELDYKHPTRYISVDVAKDLEQMVVAGFAQMDNAADIIDIRDRFAQSALENMAIAETRRRAQ